MEVDCGEDIVSSGLDHMKSRVKLFFVACDSRVERKLLDRIRKKFLKDLQRNHTGSLAFVRQNQVECDSPFSLVLGVFSVKKNIGV